MRDLLQLQALRVSRFAWVWLFVSALLGVGLETAHGFKLAAYLDDPMTRLLLRLAHAHGVGLSLVLLAYGAVGVAVFSDRPQWAVHVGRLLRMGALLIPCGFALAAPGHPEGDPGVAIWLVPVGALALLMGLGTLALASLRKIPH